MDAESQFPTHRQRREQDDATQLEPGVRIVLAPDLEPHPSRIELSAGLAEVGGRTLGGRIYCTPAYVPAPPWRDPTADEGRLLRSGASTWSPAIPPTGRTVSVFPLPRALLDGLRELGVTRLESRSDAVEFEKRADVTALLARLSEALRSRHSGPDSPRDLGLMADAGGLVTTTFNHVVGRQLGLHLDSWDRLPLEWRGTARNRIAVNLGASDRHFVFINLTLQQIAARLKERRAESSDVWGGTTCAKFLASHFSYPVVRLRVLPGEAYIAPTENLIHDGSTADSAYPDVGYHVLGRFDALRHGHTAEG